MELRADTTVPDVLAVVRAVPWCQGQLAHGDKKRVSCCLLGAIAIAAGVDAVELARHDVDSERPASALWIAALYRALDDLAVSRVIRDALPATILRQEDQPTASIYRYNDRKTTTRKDVIELLEDIIQGGGGKT